MPKAALLFLLIVCQTAVFGTSFTEDPAPRIVDAAKKVMRAYERGDRTPSYGGVHFEAAAKYGRCQQNVRELVEAALFGNEGDWPEAACCATRTSMNLRKASAKGKYIRISEIEKVLPGDLVYMDGGGTRCSRCGRGAGHAMVCVSIKNGDHVFWQNMSGLCEEKLQGWQRKRFAGAYRLAFKEAEVMKVPVPLEDQLSAAARILISQPVETKGTPREFLTLLPGNSFQKYNSMFQGDQTWPRFLP